MKVILGRLKRLEHARAVEIGNRRLEVQLGYVKSLPLEYAGERHGITVSHLPNGHHQSEERRGPARCDGDDNNGSQILRVVFVLPKHAVTENAL
jgi:hypothetical protein